MKNYFFLQLIGIIIYVVINFNNLVEYSKDVNDKIKSKDKTDHIKLAYVCSSFVFIIATLFFVNMIFTQNMDSHEKNVIIPLTAISSAMTFILIILSMVYETSLDLYQIINLLYTLFILVTAGYTLFDTEHIKHKT